MIPRRMVPQLRKMADQYPVVTLFGPRQAGKTTLCKATYPEKPYVSLEPIDTREYAKTDPRGFLAQFPESAILDEVQNAPDLLSYIQGIVDDKNKANQFILTRSEIYIDADRFGKGGR